MLPVGVGQQKEDRSKKEEDGGGGGGGGGGQKKKKHTQKKRPNQMQWLSGESTLKLTGSYRVCAKKYNDLRDLSLSIS